MRSAATATALSNSPALRIRGQVARDFEDVRFELERNFTERGELGAAVSVYVRGEQVVDLWGGQRTPTDDAPWNEDTMVAVMSCTTGLAALTLAVVAARGWLDYDAPVAEYWPEFARRGKAAITVRQLLGHQAGLVLLDEPLTITDMRHLDSVAQLLARQQPAWPAGTRHGYHTMSLGLYMQELIRHVDPAHRSLGRFFEDEVATTLGLDFHIGLPREVPDARLATVKTLSLGRLLFGLHRTPTPMIRKLLEPRSLLRSSFLFTDLDWNDRRALEIELPAANGVGTARALARAYGCLADGGAELGITPQTFAQLTAAPELADPIDLVLGVPTCFSLGFMRPCPGFGFGSNGRALGAPGAGGSFAFADPDARLGYAYVTNKLDFYVADDPREKAIRDAVYHGIARLNARELFAR